MRDWARTIAVGGLVGGTTSVVILHGLRTDLAPWAHRLSEYANGPHGWLMVLAFTALGGGLVALGVALRDPGGPHGIDRLVPFVLALAGVGAIVSGVFRTSESGTVETIHSRASAFMTVAVVAVLLVEAVPWAGRRGPRADVMGRALVGAAVALTALSVVLHDTRWTGLGQRLLWLVLLAGLLRTALGHGLDRSGLRLTPVPAGPG